MRLIIIISMSLSILLIEFNLVYANAPQPLSEDVREQIIQGTNNIPLEIQDKKNPEDHVPAKNSPALPRRITKGVSDNIRSASADQNCSDLIQNGYFTEDEGWYGNSADNVVVVPLGGGDNAVSMSTPNNSNAYLWQPIYIPREATEGMLTFLVESSLQEDLDENLYISFWDQNNNAPLTDRIPVDSAGSPGWSYFDFTILVDDNLAGQVVNLMFELWTDSDDTDSTVLIDDISFSICVQDAAAQDEHEPDNGNNQATNIELNAEPTNHSISPANDEDWVQFVLNETSAVKLMTSGSSGDTRLWLYNDNLEELAYNDDFDIDMGTFSQLVFACNENPLPAGRYYAKIDEYEQDNIIESYKISLMSEACNMASNDDFEPDNERSQAKQISSGQTQSHSIVPANDVDWVTFTLDEPSSVTFETNGSSGDTRLWLYSGDDLINSDDDSGTGYFSKLTYNCDNPLAAGTYHLMVDEYSQSSEIPNYQLSFEANGCGTVDSTRYIDLTIALYRSANTSVQRDYERTLEFFADGIYEMTNGRHKVRKITIYQNTSSGKHVMWVRDTHPRTYLSGYYEQGLHIYMADRFSYDIYSSPEQIDYCQAGYVLAHEWGHYYYGLSDEYLSPGVAVPNSVMGSQWSACGTTPNLQNLNFSAPVDFHNFSQVQSTGQYQAYMASSWEVLKRPTSQDPRNAPSRFYYPELAQVAPTGDSRATIELPNGEVEARSALNVEWVQGSPTASDTEYQTIIEINQDNIHLDTNTINYPEPVIIVAKPMRQSRYIARAESSATMILPDGTEAILELLDNGVYPDAKAEDGFYTGIFDYESPGEYEAQVSFTNPDNIADFSELAYDEADIKDIDNFELVDEPFETKSNIRFQVANVKNDDHSDTSQLSTVLVANNQDIAGRIDKQGDKDVFELKSSAEQTVRIRVADLIDMHPKVRVLSSNGQSLLDEIEWDENMVYLSTSIELQENQTVYIEVSDVDASQERGYYNLSAGPQLVSESPEATHRTNYELSSGWQVISLRALPRDGYTLTDLMDEISEDIDCDVVKIVTWGNGRWSAITPSSAFPPSAEPDTPYFINTLCGGSVSLISNQSPNQISSVSLETGWEFIVLPDSAQGMSAEDACLQIENQGGKIQKISQWNGGRWVSHRCGGAFPMSLEPGESYFILSDIKSTWTPQEVVVAGATQSLDPKPTHTAERDGSLIYLPIIVR